MIAVVTERSKIDGDIAVRRDTVVSVVVVLDIDDGIRPIGMGDVPTDRHPVEALRAVKAGVVEDTARH